MKRIWGEIAQFLRRTGYAEILKKAHPTVVIGGTLLAASAMPELLVSIVGDLGANLIEEFIRRWFSRRKNMSIGKEKREEYIAGLNKEEFEELAKELGEKISKIFHNELREFFEELKKDDELKGIFEEIIGRKVDVITKEIGKLHEEHLEILKELRMSGLVSLEEFIEKWKNRRNEEEEKRLRNEREKERFYEGFKIRGWAPIIEGWDIKREISDEIEKELKEKTGVLIIGESGSGKSVLIKRVAYSLYEQGWKCFERVGSININGILKAFENDTNYIILIDNASDYSDEIKELLNAINEKGIENIKLLMAERTDKWAEGGLSEYELKENDVVLKELKLTPKDIKNFLGKKYGLKGEELEIISSYFTKIFAGKKGEFIFLLMMGSEKRERKEIIKRKYVSIFEESRLSEYEKNLLRRIFTIRAYEGDYPKSIIEMGRGSGELEEIQSSLNSLERKGHIIYNEYIETYHPFLCKEFLQMAIERRELSIGIVKIYFEEYLKNMENFVNLLRVGTNIGIEKNLDLMSISVEFLEKAVKVSKKGREKAGALNNLGIALSRWALIKGKEPEEARKKYEKAIECYDRALEINPNFVEAWNNKGNVLDELGRYEEAIECYDKALEINPNYAEAWNNKGVTLSMLRRYEEAIECFDRALEINPNYAKVWYNKGNVLGKLERHKEAVESKGKAAFLFYLEGGTDFVFKIFKEVYDKRLDIPICYECGVALASLLYLRNEVYDEIVADCNRNKDKICSSAKIVLKYLIDGEIERNRSKR